LTNQLFHEKELAFFGSITASATHELNNVLSIINEYSGLLEDLAILSEKGKPIDAQRISKIASNIGEQVKREKTIIKLLNRFAHRVDSPLIDFNLNELVNDITRLSQRFASLKKVDLEIVPTIEQFNITNNPFLVQQCIFSCIKLALEFLEIKDNISIKLEEEKSKVSIKITSPPLLENSQIAEKKDFLYQLMKSLGGEIISDTIENHHHFNLILPYSISDGVLDHEEEETDEH